jgi:hypothetical protein
MVGTLGSDGPYANCIWSTRFDRRADPRTRAVRRSQRETILRRGLNEPFLLSGDSGIRESNSAWIPQAEITRRLDVSPRVVRRRVDCGYLTMRLIPGCQARVLADDVDRLVAQHARTARNAEVGSRKSELNQFIPHSAFRISSKSPGQHPFS